jgi:hypothetical protein
MHEAILLILREHARQGASFGKPAVDVEQERLEIGWLDALGEERGNAWHSELALDAVGNTRHRE